MLASAGSTPLVHDVRVTSASAVSRIISAEAPEKRATESGGGDAASAPATPSSSSSVLDPLAKLPALDDVKCRERLERAVHAAATRAAKIGVGVTKRAQAAFDALDKTLPCAWGSGDASSSSIFVLGEVVVVGPDYVPESASVVAGAAAKASSQTLERVRMVLDAAKDELPPP